MITTLNSADLSLFVVRQLASFFPDGDSVCAARIEQPLTEALDRIEHCFQRIAHERYHRAGQSRFDHLNSDQYCQFLCFLAHAAWRDAQDEALARKIFCLNKALHAFNCMYDTVLPDIFWIIHAVGAVIGKAKLSDYLVIRQNCTIGALRGEFPEIGPGLILSAGAMVIGRCRIGANVMLGPGCVVMNQDVPENTLVRNVPALEFKPNSPRAMSVHFDPGAAARRAGSTSQRSDAA